MTGWVPTPADGWAEIAELLTSTGQPWPRSGAVTDLRWHVDQGIALPGRRELSERWRWTPHEVRTLLADTASWWDPTKGSPPADRREIEDRVPVRQRRIRPPVAHPSPTERPPHNGQTPTPSDESPTRRPPVAHPSPSRADVAPSPSPSPDSVSLRARDPDPVDLSHELLVGACQALQNDTRPDLGVTLSADDRREIRNTRRLLGWDVSDFTVLHEYTAASSEMSWWRDNGKDRWSSMLKNRDEAQNRLRAAKAWVDRGRVDPVAQGPPRAAAEHRSLISLLAEDAASDQDSSYEQPFRQRHS